MNPYEELFSDDRPTPTITPIPNQPHYLPTPPITVMDNYNQNPEEE